MAKLQIVRRASKGYAGSKAKAIYVHMGVWLDSKSRDIHLTVPTDKKFHTTVSNKAKSKRYHSNLYSKLEKLLKKHDCWGE